MTALSTPDSALATRRKSKTARFAPLASNLPGSALTPTRSIGRGTPASPPPAETADSPDADSVDPQ